MSSIIEGEFEVMERTGSPATKTTLALARVAQPMTDSALTLSRYFTGVGDKNHPVVDQRGFMRPLVPPFVPGQLEQLEKVLEHSLAAMGVVNQLVDVLMVDDPGFVKEVLTALQDGSVMPVDGEDKVVFRGKLKRAQRLGIADIDLLRLAQTPQVRTFLGIAGWYLDRRLDAEAVLSSVHDQLGRYGVGAQDYAKQIEAAYSAYRRHSAGVISAAQRRFGTAVRGLEGLDLTNLNGSELDDGMKEARMYVRELATSIQVVGDSAVSQMESAFKAQRMTQRARVIAAQTATLATQARKMFEIMQLSDTGFVLAVSAPAEILSGAITDVLSGVVGTLKEAELSFKPMVESCLVAPVANPTYLTDGQGEDRALLVK